MCTLGRDISEEWQIAYVLLDMFSCFLILRLGFVHGWWLLEQHFSCCLKQKNTSFTNMRSGEHVITLCRNPLNLFLYWDISISSKWRFLWFFQWNLSHVHQIREQWGLAAPCGRGAGCQVKQQLMTLQSQDILARRAEQLGDSNSVQLRVKTTRQL